MSCATSAALFWAMTMIDPHAEEDLYALITAPEPQPPAPAPKRIPLWKLEEMRTGQVARPDGWRGSTRPLMSGWEADQVQTSSSVRDLRPRRKPWPLRAVHAVTKFILLSAVAILAAMVVALGVGILSGGRVNLPAVIGVVNQITGANHQAESAPRTPARPVAPVEPAPTAPAPAVAAPAPAAQAPAPPAVPATPAVPAARAATDRPTPGREEHGGPLGKPAPITVGSNSYAFTNLRDDGTPVAYSPCRPIHYVTRAANAPAGGDQLIKEAVTAVSRATGLVFIDDGATTEAPAAKHVSYQPARYGDRWAPVLIAWETNVEEPRFTNPEYGSTVLGLGGSEAVSVGSIPFTYVSGQLELNGPALARMITRDGAAAARGVIEHELGHVVGLGHINDPTQLMNESASTTVTTYAPGDLSGLALLGQGQCAPGL
jgi:hypothetical protein